MVPHHPSVIPIDDIEPAYRPLISVCQELETPAGFLDNFWITPEGGIVLGECKLVRNPQARREVVAQALDYARAVSSWRFEELERQAAKARKQREFTLWSLVSDADGLDETRFHDAVERRLRAGHVMVLVIGDGITEGAEALTSFLQMHAGFHAGLALVDLSVWSLEDGSRLVVPRVPMKTKVIERGIVRVEPSGHSSIQPITPEVADTTMAQSASEQEFYEQLRSRRPELVDELKRFAAELESVGVSPEFRKSLVLRWMLSPDQRMSAGYIDSGGIVWLGDSVNGARKLGQGAAATRYLEAIAAAVGGTARPEVHHPTVLGPHGRTVTIADLLPARKRWLEAIGDYISNIKQAAAIQPV